MRAFTLLMTCTLAAGPAFAQKGDTGTMPKDRDFVQKAATGGLAEVKMSKLALDRSQSPQVKEFAQKMIQDHSKANDELKQIARKQNIRVPAELTPEQKMTYDKLKQLSGNDFDRMYMEVMARDHQAAVDAFTQQADEGTNPALKQFASQTLPTLKQHEMMLHKEKELP